MNIDTCDEVGAMSFINNELMTALALSSWVYREKCETNLSEWEEARILEGDRIYFRLFCVLPSTTNYSHCEGSCAGLARPPQLHFEQRQRQAEQLALPCWFTQGSHNCISPVTQKCRDFSFSLKYVPESRKTYCFIFSTSCRLLFF